MTVRSFTDFGKLVSDFLGHYLPEQRKASERTIESYTEAFKLFFKFLREAKGINPDRFSLKRFNKKLILEFIEWLMKERDNSPSSANQRLSAMKSFADYVFYEKPSCARSMQTVKSIKVIHTEKRPTSHLTFEQMKVLINKPDDKTRNGLRYRTILSMLYESAARIDEFCNLRKGDILFDEPYTKITLRGKGKKTRTIPIPREMADLLKVYLDKYLPDALSDDFIMVNQNGKQITKDGVIYIIKKFIKEIQKEDPHFPGDIHCHSFRKSKATHMMESGIPLNYIRDFLGHESIQTTLIYAKVNNRKKEEAIMKATRKIVGEVKAEKEYNASNRLDEYLNRFS